MMGVTFAAVGPMLSMAADPGIGVLGIYGSVIAAGLFGVIIAPFISKPAAAVPAGRHRRRSSSSSAMSLMRVAINWAAGGQPTIMKVVDGVPGAFPNPAYGGLQAASASRCSRSLLILALIRWGSGFIANVSVLLGIIGGALLAVVLGLMHFDKVGKAAWFAFVTPFHFGVPQFHLVPILTMCVVMIVVMIESLGMFLALSEMTGKVIDQHELTRGLRADGVGTMLGGIFNTFPYSSFSQNVGLVGLVGITGVKSRWVTVTGGCIMIVLGLLPKSAALVEAIPQTVLGGAGIVMFGMVAATGARILTEVNFRENAYNLYVVAISVGFGTITMVSPLFRGGTSLLNRLLQR